VSAAVSLAPEAAVERVRFSRLKLFAKSAAHYLENPRKDTATLDKGTGVHSLLLKGQRVTYYDRKTESGKAAPRNGQHWEKFQADNFGALILSQSEYDETMRMVDSVRANPFAMELLKGKIEDTIEFDFLDIPSRTTPDARTPNVVVELKTCRSSEPHAFAWQMKKLFYHAQMAFHVEGMCSLNSKLNPTPYIVAVESSPPYPVTVFRVTPAAMLEGHKLIRLWFEQLKVCTAANVWPAYSQAVVDLDVPGMDQDVGVIFGDETTDAA
jgi:PDDEXK-like domain of unknown function (DUF3799)